VHVDYPGFARLLTYSLMVVVPALSLKLIHGMNPIETSGFNTERIFLYTSLAFLVAPFCFAFIMGMPIGDPTPVLWAPIAEEWFFRLYLIGPYLMRDIREGKLRIRTISTFLVSSILFVALHFLNLTDQFWLEQLSIPGLMRRLYSGSEAVGLFVLSILATVAYYLTGTIVSSIALHSAFNFKSLGYDAVALIVTIDILTWYLLRRIRPRKESVAFWNNEISPQAVLVVSRATGSASSGTTTGLRLLAHSLEQPHHYRKATKAD